MAELPEYAPAPLSLRGQVPISSFGPVRLEPSLALSNQAIPTRRMAEADVYAPPPTTYTPPSQRTTLPLATDATPLGVSALPSAGLQTNLQPDSVIPDVLAGAGSVATGAAALTGAGSAAGAGVLGTLAAAAPVVGAIGGLVGLGVSWYYANKAQKEQERVNKANERRAAAAAAEEKRRWEINLELTKMKMGQEERRARMEQALRANQAKWQKELQEEQLSMQKADRKEIARQNRVQQAINLLMGTMQLFNTPANREHNYAFWAQRAK